MSGRSAKTVEQMRAEAREHARQIDAVLWMTVDDLAARWGVARGTVRAIDRTRLKYLTLGKSKVRRYHPDDVRAFEEAEKTVALEPTPAEKSA